MAAALPNLTPASSDLDVKEQLAALQAGTTQSITLYPHPVSFNSPAHKASWHATFPNLDSSNHTIAQFFTHQLGGRINRAGLFISDTDTWVGVPYNTDRHYHAWAGVIMGWPGRLGKRIAIWDPNGRDRLGAARGAYLFNAVTIGGQRALVARAKDRMRVEEVWYAGEGERENKDDCRLDLVVDWLRRIMAEGLPEDLAAAGWVKLQG